MSRIDHCINYGPTEELWGIIETEMHSMDDIKNEVSLRFNIKNHLKFYNYERPQERYGLKTPLEVRKEALAKAVPEKYPIAANKRIQKYKINGLYMTATQNCLAVMRKYLAYPLDRGHIRIHTQQLTKNPKSFPSSFIIGETENILHLEPLRPGIVPSH